MNPFCELPEDWNPNKEPRAELIRRGYDLFDWCRTGRSHYETWVVQETWGPVYHMIHYRWSNEEGWVPAIQSQLLSADREDLMVHHRTNTKLVIHVNQEEKEDVPN